MMTYVEKLENAKKYVKEIEMFANATCNEHELCNNCPFYRFFKSDGIDVCMAIDRLKSLTLE